jgi:hypothetical protein
MPRSPPLASCLDQVCSRHSVIAASLRSAARCAATCGVNPSRCSRYDVPRNVYDTPNSRVISAVTRANVQR